MSNLLTLAHRVEKLTGPDREADVLIWAEIDGRDVSYEDNWLLGRSRNAPHDECRLGFIDPGRVQRNFSPAFSSPDFPRYTNSLDVAMALVPPNAGIHLTRYWIAATEGPVWSASICTGGVPGNPARVFEAVDASSAANATTAAALRALSPTPPVDKANG